MGAVPDGESAVAVAKGAEVTETDGQNVVAEVVEVVRKASVTRATATASTHPAVAESSRGEAVAEVADAVMRDSGDERLAERTGSIDTATHTAESSAAIIGTTTIGADDDAEVVEVV